MKINHIRRVLLISFLVLLNFSCDQISKNIVRNKTKSNEIIHVLKDILILKKVENTGAALGLGGNLPSTLKTIYFKILPVVFLLFLFRMILIETEFSKLLVVGLGFAIGGGAGNLYDRIVYGSVTDFIILEAGILKAVIFNIADVSIIVGIVLVFIEISLNKKNN